MEKKMLLKRQKMATYQFYALEILLNTVLFIVILFMCQQEKFLQSKK